MSFETKCKKKKSTEPVWMTEEIRGLIKKRRRLYRRIKRTGQWKEIKVLVALKVAECKKGHGEYVRQKFKDDKDSQNFYRSVNAIMKGCEQETWDVWSLFPNEDDFSVAEKLADFSNKISSEYSPIKEEDIPTSHDVATPVISENQVRNKLIK